MRRTGAFLTVPVAIFRFEKSNGIFFLNFDSSVYMEADFEISDVRGVTYIFVSGSTVRDQVALVFMYFVDHTEIQVFFSFLYFMVIKKIGILSFAAKTNC